MGGDLRRLQRDADGSVRLVHRFAETVAERERDAAPPCPAPDGRARLRIETRAGHGAGKPVWMQIEDIADQFGFVAKALGMPAPG